MRQCTSRSPEVASATSLAGSRRSRKPSPARVEAPLHSFRFVWRMPVAIGGIRSPARLEAGDRLRPIDASRRDARCRGPEHDRPRTSIWLSQSDGLQAGPVDRPALSRAASHELVDDHRSATSWCRRSRSAVSSNCRRGRRRAASPSGRELATGQTLAMFDDETGVIEEVVAGCTFRVTGRAFFQNNTAGAEALVRLVREALQPEDGRCTGRRLCGRWSVRRHRRPWLPERDRGRVRSDRGRRFRAQRWRPSTCESSSSRRLRCSPRPSIWRLSTRRGAGLGKEPVWRCWRADGRGRSPMSPAIRPRSPATPDFWASGATPLEWVQPVDMFPQTFHVEMVGCFVAGWHEAGARPGTRLIRLMDFGVVLQTNPPSSRVVELAKTAEDLRFSYAWTFDSHVLWQEPFVIFSRILAATSRMTVGPMVTNPGTRDWTVLASLFATLNEMYGPRTVCGMGRGDSALRYIGRTPTTLETTAAATRVIKDLVAGKEVEYNGKALQLPWVGEGWDLPVWMAAYGPKALASAGHQLRRLHPAIGRCPDRRMDRRGGAGGGGRGGSRPRVPHDLRRGAGLRRR